MSYLARPRAHFYGKFIANPATGNNAATDSEGQAYYDVAEASVDLRGQSPEEFRDWFRRRNIAGYVNALWNYYGNNSVYFDSAKIVSIQMPEGGVITDAAQDALIGGEIGLAGNSGTPAVIVDVDPTDAFTSQIFSDIFSITLGDVPLLRAADARRCYSRWLNYWRNLMVEGDRGSSAVWQIALPKAGLTFANSQRSPLLRAFEDAMPRAAGLVVRFCTYLFRHLPYRDIGQKFQREEYTATSGQLIVVGSIGLWNAGEPESMPPARLLVPSLDTAYEIPPALRSLRSRSAFHLGPILAEVDTRRKVVTLDVISTFPEVDSFDTLDAAKTVETTPEKLDLGTLSLWAQEPCTPQRDHIGNLPFQAQAENPAYDKSAYFLTGGLVEMSYAPEVEDRILNGDLVLLQGTDSKAPILMQENPYQVLTDSRGLYLELENTSPVDIPLQVLLRGKPAPPDEIFPITQSRNQRLAPVSSVRLVDTRGSGDLDHTREGAFQVALRDEQIVKLPSSVTTDADGRAILRLQPSQAGTCKVWITTPGDLDLQKISDRMDQYFLRGATGHFINVRVLPDDRALDSIPDSDLTWELMYAKVFRYYSLIYPAMNMYINFDDERAVTSSAERIAESVDSQDANRTYYMPITRELSAGKRRLIQRWAKQKRSQ